MPGTGNLIVGGQLQVTVGLPNGIPGPPATVFGGSAAGPPVNGSAWIEGPMLLGSPLAYPLPRPAATLMLGRTQNYLAPELKGLPILAITSRGFAPTPTDLLIGDPAGIVGMTVNSSTITVTNKTVIGIFSKNLTGVIPNVNLVGKKLGIVAKTTVTGKTAITGITKIGPKLVVLGKLNVNGALRVQATISSPTIAELRAKIATKKTKPFDMPHPNKKGWRLRHVCIEGPEIAVYCRGKVPEDGIINLPSFWEGLVNVEDMSINITPLGCWQELFVKEVLWGKQVVVRNNAGGPINADYHIVARRIDDDLIVEYEGESHEDYPGGNEDYSFDFESNYVENLIKDTVRSHIDSKLQIATTK
jgi:hypothetical protein